MHDLTSSHGITLIGMGGGAAGEVGLTSPRQSPPGFWPGPLFQKNQAYFSLLLFQKGLSGLSGEPR